MLSYGWVLAVGFLCGLGGVAIGVFTVLAVERNKRKQTSVVVPTVDYPEYPGVVSVERPDNRKARVYRSREFKAVMESNIARERRKRLAGIS